jgi:hypothetical protein
MVALFHGVVHTAANEVNAGRLTDDDAPRVISATLHAAFAPTSHM